MTAWEAPKAVSAAALASSMGGVGGDEAPVLAPSDAAQSAQANLAPVTPTWTAIYARYLGPNTQGACGRSRACHADAMSDAPSAYDWLAGRGYISGTRSALVSPSNSCLRWFGGNMPPRAEANDEATRDLSAWVAAGAAND